ncbi:MAG TPA: hypothetical protein VG028_13275 [Terriglobia bacterium]|nr:hypothetical protein [Terriglobia bacterium]
MDVYSKHAASLKALQAYHGAACPLFVWNGINIPILPGSAVRGKDLGMGGFKLRSDLKFTVNVSDLQSLAGGGPQLKQIITYLGDPYRIDSIEKFEGGLLQRFECNDPSQGI